MTIIKDNSTVLFQGDSITDCGPYYKDGNNMWHGYAMIAAALFSALHPEKNINFINRGVSGNRTKDLAARWQKDCVDLKPDVVSILIGINDTWRRYDSNEPTGPEDFEKNYRGILSRTKNELGAKIIMLEPFLLNVSEEKQTWREDLDIKRKTVKELAKEFEAIFIPLDAIFGKITSREPSYWSADGVHPTPAGHALIALEWLKATKSI